jgi:general secretion pathway protein J
MPKKRLEVAVAALDEWKVFYFRTGAWTNPLSSDDSAPPPPPPGTADATNKPAGPDLVLPDGVRLVLTLPVDGAISGTLTRDWVRLSLAGGNS